MNKYTTIRIKRENALNLQKLKKDMSEDYDVVLERIIKENKNIGKVKK